MNGNTKSLLRFASVLAVCALTSAPLLAQTHGGNLVTVMRGDPKGLIPAFPHGGDTRIVAAKIFEGLLNYTSDLEPIPALAKSWEVSEDGTVYTFHLQSGVKWHDGADFSSADVVFSLGTMLPAVNAAAEQSLQNVKSIEAPDAETVVITLDQPVPYFLMLFPGQQMPIMPKHIYEGTDYANNPANAAPVGTGPFRFVTWERGSYLRLERNADYWDADLPYLDAVTYRIMPDAASRGIALETGDVQVASSLELSSSDISRMRKDGVLELNPAGWEYFASQSLLSINMRTAPMDNLDFRRALYHAVDRQFVRDHIWGGLGKLSAGPVSASTKYFTADLPGYDFNVETANALLDEMGTTLGADGMRVDAAGNPLRVGLLILPGEPYGRLAEYLREAWRKIGVETELQTVDLANWYDRMSNWNYDIAIAALGQFADPGIGSRSYYHSDNIRKGVMFSNMGGYANPEVDALYDEAGMEMDPAKRADLYARIQTKIVEDVPAIWLLDLERLTISHKSVHGVVTDAFGPWGSWREAYIDQ
ncbi:ABC transporter substrate-binding protein [Neotabrizicola sp. VNH66]|uniref:ABC transporter substrate-binding protein n=1 Tax=Neotabrizicola sp. VNH66 TaxID=3400918 RepID=UPI003C00E93E